MIQTFEVKLTVHVDNDIDGDGPVPLTENDVHNMMSEERTYNDDTIIGILVNEVEEVKRK
jgi:hypothetical protein